MNLPNPEIIRSGEQFDLTRMTQPTVLFGAGDDAIATPSSQRAYFNRLSGPAGVAVLTAANHSTVQPDGGGFRGYLTAWLEHRLRHDDLGKAVFVGSSAELIANAAWQDQATRGLL